ncbi:MAG TPA: hypothetical protein VMM76_03775 [Pirellulaceae bacterium]|nr:hypothetical protein [Pirellulaceae bacterium]
MSLARLTAFEEYMFRDDCPAYPMTGTFRLRFAGRVDRESFESAVHHAVARHPLLRATVEQRRWRRPRWIEQPDWLPEIEWDAETNEFGCPNASFMNLTESPGTRVWMTETPRGSSAIFQVHHACTDALGMTQAFEDILIGYARRRDTNTKAELAVLAHDRFPGRGAPDLTVWRFMRMAHKQAVGLLGARQFLFRQPAALQERREELDVNAAPRCFPAATTFPFDIDETRAMLATAKSLGSTVNDLLARDMFLALGRWRKANGIGTDKDWLRFAVPMNLRREADARLPMCNSVSYVFLDRQPREFDDETKLLESIRAEMGRIKRCELQYTSVLSLAASRMLPGGLAAATPPNKCMSTCVFTNPGIVLRKTPLPRDDGRLVAGDVILDGVDYIPPLRPNTGAAICPYTYAGRLNILMHHDPRIVSNEQAASLLGMYVEQLRKSSAHAATSSSRAASEPSPLLTETST